MALLTLPLAGCPTAPPKYVGAPELLHVEGVYNHQGSGLRFPAEVGSFRRASVIRYDAEGLDVAVGYTVAMPGALISATVYVYPAPSILSIGSPPHVVAAARANASEREFELRKREILLEHPGGKLTEEAAFSLQSGPVTYSGQRAVFALDEMFAGVRQPLRSELYLFPFIADKWTVKYRFTYPRELDGSEEIKMLMLAVPWSSAPS